jgi:RNA polymerase sigma factor (sigma-70 family)
VPRTLAEDGDPLDILILGDSPTFPGCVYDARPIGLFEMLDQGVRDPQAGGDSVDPERVLEGHELGDRLKLALEQLPEKQRLAVLMFTIEGLPQKQVAEALECSVEAVKWHVFQARKKLKELLKDVM